MAKKYVVAKGHSILHKGELMMPGSFVDSSLPGFKAHVEHKFVVVKGREDEEDEDEAPILEPDQDEAGIKIKAVGKWNMDPKLLEKKTLDQLNVLVRERDAKVLPFETKLEAVAHLSQDFKAAK